MRETIEKHHADQCRNDRNNEAIPKTIIARTRLVQQRAESLKSVCRSRGGSWITVSVDPNPAGFGAKSGGVGRREHLSHFSEACFCSASN